MIALPKINGELLGWMLSGRVNFLSITPQIIVKPLQAVKDVVLFKTLYAYFFNHTFCFRYRQVKEPELKKVEGNSPVMGLYLGCHRTGTVKLRDPVYVAV